MGLRFNLPPGWPPPPAGFVFPPGWQPDPSWPPLPPGWRLWVDDQPIPARSAQPWSAAPPPPGYDPTASPYDQGPNPSPYDQGPNPYDQGPGPYDQAAAYGPGYPGGPGMPYAPASQPPTRAKFSRWAIVSFVFGLLSIVVVSIICSIVALGRIKMFGQRGRGLAIASLAVSGTWIVAGILVLVLVHLSHATRSPAGEITHSGHLSVFSLSVGDCFNNPAGASPVSSVIAIPCNQAHNAQVFAKFNLAGDDTYPGEAAATRVGADGCNLRLGVLDKSKVTDSMTTRFLFPPQKTWLDGNQAITCMIVNYAGNITYSVLKH